MFSCTKSLKGTYSSLLWYNIALITIRYIIDISRKILLFLCENSSVYVYKLSYGKKHTVARLCFSKLKEYQNLKCRLVFMNVCNQI